MSDAKNRHPRIVGDGEKWWLILHDDDFCSDFSVGIDNDEGSYITMTWSEFDEIHEAIQKIRKDGAWAIRCPVCGIVALNFLRSREENGKRRDAFLKTHESCLRRTNG